MENKKVANDYRLRILNKLIKDEQNPFEVVVKEGSESVLMRVEDIRYYFGGLNKSFDYLMEE